VIINRSMIWSKRQLSSACCLWLS